jgi:hypothetical protein
MLPSFIESSRVSGVSSSRKPHTDWDVPGSGLNDRLCSALCQRASQIREISNFSVDKLGERRVACVSECSRNAFGDDIENFEIVTRRRASGTTERFRNHGRFWTLWRDADDCRAPTRPPVERERPIRCSSIEEIGSLLLTDIDVITDSKRNAFDRDRPALALEEAMHQVRKDDERFWRVDRRVGF